MTQIHNSDNPVRIGDRLIAARLNAGLTQAELGHLCGIRQSHVSAMERGVRGPSMELASRLATALGITVHWLLGGDSCETLANREMSPDRLLSDSKTAAGLAALAADTARCDYLSVQPVEWLALRAITPPQPLTKEGYLAILLAFRGHVERR